MDREVGQRHVLLGQPVTQANDVCDSGIAVRKITVALIFLFGFCFAARPVYFRGLKKKTPGREAGLRYICSGGRAGDITARRPTL